MTLADVVNAAVRIILDEGPDACGISRVARELGIRPASMYNHVASGDALISAVALEGTRRLLTALKTAVRGVFDADEQLRQLAHGVRDWALDNGGLYGLMARVKPDFSDADATAVGQDLLDLFERPLGQLGVAAQDRVHAIRSLRAAVHGFVMLQNSGQFQLPEDVDESFQLLVDTLIKGVVETHSD